MGDTGVHIDSLVEYIGSGNLFTYCKVVCVYPGNVVDLIAWDFCKAKFVPVNLVRHASDNTNDFWRFPR